MKDLERLIDELIDHQKKTFFKMAQQIIPRITPDDLLQLNDFPKLESDPLIRYEEGVLHGLQVAQALLHKENN